jgi:hypothetical protein
VIERARHDTSHLEGDVPTGLGRNLEVHLSRAMPKTRKALLAALEREFVSRDLFDTVAGVEDSGTTRVPSAGLWITVDKADDLSTFDPVEFSDVYWVRLSLDVELRDASGVVVLAGHVDGIGVDDVSDDEYVNGPKREDIRLAAIHDAAMKISHGLRRTAFSRQTQALKGLPEIGLPQGMAPLTIAVLGFDDAPNAFRLRGARLTDLLTDTMIRLGSDFDVTPHDRAQRAVGRERVDGFYEIADYKVTQIGQHLTARVFVVGQIELEGGRVTGRARLMTRKGVLLASKEAMAEGVGAMPVVAVKLAHRLGEALQEITLPTDSRE